MKRYLFLLVACLFVTMAQAQNPNTKWGKPSQTEWSLQAWGEAPDAEAVVLNRTMTVSYTISRQFSSYGNANTELSVSNIEFLGNNENSNVRAHYENKLRIKILKDSGANYANVDVVYLNDEKDTKIFDEIARVKVMVFSQNEKGKVSRRMVKAESLKHERLDAHYNVLHIRVPDVKQGDIIEYTYEIESTRVAYLYDCSFQEDIPVLYAKCDMNIPGFLSFDMKVPVHPFIKSKVERASISEEQTMGDMQAPKSYPSNHYIIEGHDILPKDLDLQRNGADTEAAKVSSSSAKIMRTVANIKAPGNSQPVPMPKDVNHLMINAK